MGKRYELSIKANYLPGWGLWEGVRELIQNARDAELQFNAPMNVSFAKRIRNKQETGALVIINRDTILPKESLLIGHTTKDGHDELIGKFGEGLKYGILALLRLGVEIKIRNGTEVWLPRIDRSEKYNADVLVFDVTSGHKDERRVQFEVVGLDSSDWDDIKNKLLFLDNEYPNNISVEGGKIITDPAYCGKLFVKGMFVAFDSSLSFGYDFDHADIDRDRRMINSLHDSTSHLLSKAVNKGCLSDKVYEILKTGSGEASYVSSYNLNQTGRKAIADAFLLENPGAVAVENSSQVAELEVYNIKGVVTSWNLRGIIEGEIGSSNAKLNDLRKSSVKEYSFNELSGSEKDNLRLAVNMVSRAMKVVGDLDLNIDRVNIVDFSKNDMLGTYNIETGNIRIAKKILSDKGNLLYILIHEAAHSHGYDGSISHERAIGQLTSAVFNNIL